MMLINFYGILKRDQFCITTAMDLYIRLMLRNVLASTCSNSVDAARAQEHGRSKPERGTAIDLPLHHAVL